MDNLRFVLAFSALILLRSGALAAQSSSSTDAPRTGVDSSRSIPVAGVYTLVAVDGHALPYELRHEGAPPGAPPLDVLASTLIVRSDGSFIQAMGYRITTSGANRFVAQPFSGQFRTDGAALVAKWDGAGLTPVSFARDTMAINNEGIRLQYVKGR